MTDICNNKIKKFCIILVIASPGERYNLLKEVLIKFMNSNENFKTYFIYGDINKDNIIKSDYDLFFDINESFIPGIFQKTIKAIKYINNKYDYKYIIRTNLSTFWRLDKLYDYLNNINIPYFCGGHIDHINKYTLHITGTGIILSKYPSLYLSQDNIYNYGKNIIMNDDILITKLLLKKFKVYNCIKRNHTFFKNDINVYYEKNENNIYTNYDQNDFYFRLKSNKDYDKMNQMFKIYY